MINKIPFRIDWPIEVFDYSKQIDLQNKKSMENIFKRTIHYNNYSNNPLLIFEQRINKYNFSLERILDYLHKDYSPSDISNISLFGSSLFSEKPDDYDFLIFVRGNEFKLEHLRGNFGKENIEMGLSIKGVDNYKKGPSQLFTEKQKNIIHRTTVSLFRRRVPIYGFDFVENEKLFLENLDSQISDLLYNSYGAYYLENEKNFSEQKRSRKLLNRLYEAIACSEFKYSSSEVKKLGEKVYVAINKPSSLKESKVIYDEVFSFLSKKIPSIGFL